MRYIFLTIIFLFFLQGVVNCQVVPLPPPVLLKGGHLIDPKNGINEIMDVAISDGKITKVGKNIKPQDSAKIIDATGMYITPGLIDIHTHVFVGTKAATFGDGVLSLSPDDFTFRSGITTVVDVGSSGWRTFPIFKQQVIDQSLTRILAFINIAGSGMTGFPTEQEMNDMDARMTSLVIEKYPDLIVGIKIGHYGGTDWAPFERTLEAGRLANVPIIVEAHLPKLPLEEMLKRMRPGDIFTQAFKRATSERLSVVDAQGKVWPFVLEAKKKGILFDVGHGGGSFHFSTAVPAYKQGLMPNSFGTDLHRQSMNAGMKDMLNIMSKYMVIGMTIQEVVLRATWNSANYIKHTELGHLTPGAIADVTVLSIRNGNFGFLDAANTTIKGKSKLECELTIKGGKIVYDLNGMAATETITIK